MNSKLPINAVASKLAQRANISEEMERSFVSSLFAEAAETIIRGYEVKIKGIGTFHTNGDFTPDTSLADKVNSPFSFFEAVELSPDVTDSMLDDLDSESKHPNEVEAETEQESCVPLQSHPVDQPKPETTDNVVDEASNDSDTLPDINIEESKLQSVDIDNVSTSTNDATQQEENRSQTERSSNNMLRYAACLAIGFILGIATIYVFMPISVTPNDEPSDLYTAESPVQVSTQPTVTDSVERSIADETEAVDVKAKVETAITDTVRSGYYFTTMAKRHYGDKSFWVYIYDHNARRLNLTHPERILPGTVVEIPDASLYGIDPEDDNSIHIAKEKAREIYNRFN